MKIDRIKQQEEFPSIQHVREMLHCVKPPEKTQAQWSAVEKNLFRSLNSLEGTEKKRVANFIKNLFRPAALVPGIAAALLLIVVSIGHFAQKNKPIIAHALDVRGKLLVYSNKSEVNISKLGASLPISKGFSFTTLDKSSFILQLGNECALALSPNSNLAIKELSATRIIFNLSYGALLAKVNKRSKIQKFNVVTPEAVCMVTGTIFKVDVLPKSDHTPLQTVLTVYEGNVMFAPSRRSREQRQLVVAGQRCSSTPGSAPYYYVSEFETPIKAISTLELLVNSKYSTQQASGLVDVSSHPEEALVMLDDTIVGKTPLVLRKPIGTHRIIVSTQGYSPWERQFTIGRDSISSFSASLVPLQLPARTDRNTILARKIKKRALHMMPADPESLLVAFPDYVEANIQLSIGEYQKALGLLDSLKNNYPLDMKNRKSIMNKINGCYAKLGDFTGALASLQDKLDMASTSSIPGEKEHLLWEIANLNANCIGDYEGAEFALLDLSAAGAGGYRIYEAYEKLAEVRYILGKFDSAAATYRTLLQKFPDFPGRERVLFSLASILDDDKNLLKEAIEMYSKVINDFPRSNYFKAALFARAECFDRLGRVVEAHNDYKKCLALDPHGIWNSACAERLRTFKK